MARIVRQLRLLEYIGPEEWLEATVANSFVQLKKELGPNRTIKSNWVGEPELVQEINEFITPISLEADNG